MGRKVSHIRRRVYDKKAIGWNRMSDIIGYRASKSCMSNTHYLHCNFLHSLPNQNLHQKTQRIQAGNGHFASVLFIIPIIIDIHGHIFEMYTLVSEVYENVDLVFGIKNILELEGIINS